ncbi:4-demethylwyosine synthase TYW1 [Candidatus Pacearchaeota archaeon]|nr:4-demethylwyosine synthase TYW1 [Candidatus Pacearchaeota archaeon]
MEEKKFSEERIERYEKAGYRILGEQKHSAIKVCRWAKESLRGKGDCYKKIFGVKSHRCIQMTPTLNLCNFSCGFCWRPFAENRHKAILDWDSPSAIIEDAIKFHKDVLAGFGGSKYVAKKKLKEAMQPAHFAISLDGEPTLYPHLAELINEIKARGFSVFIVTNGTMPEKIKEIFSKDAIPDNLSVSIYATTQEGYQNVTNCSDGDVLEKVKESLSLLRKFENCRTNIRLTLVKDLNMDDVEGYASLIKIGEPKFVTIKGYSHLGHSQKRLKFEQMPTMEELRDFAREISEKNGYLIKYEDELRRAIILVRDEETWEWNKKKIAEQEERFLASGKN